MFHKLGIMIQTKQWLIRRDDDDDDTQVQVTSVMLSAEEGTQPIDNNIFCGEPITTTMHHCLW